MDYYPLSDLLYRTVALTDDNADIVEAYDTDAYGNTLVFTDPGPDEAWFTDDDVPTDAPLCPFIFTGRRYDPETEIYFYRARYYHPELGRFTSRDPLDYWPGMSLYGYGGCRPTQYTDPYGLRVQWLTGKVRAAVRAAKKFLGMTSQVTPPMPSKDWADPIYRDNVVGLVELESMPQECCEGSRRFLKVEYDVRILYKYKIGTIYEKSRVQTEWEVECVCDKLTGNFVWVRTDRWSSVKTGPAPSQWHQQGVRQAAYPETGRDLSERMEKWEEKYGGAKEEPRHLYSEMDYDSSTPGPCNVPLPLPPGAKVLETAEKGLLRATSEAGRAEYEKTMHEGLRP